MASSSDEALTLVLSSWPDITLPSDACPEGAEFDIKFGDQLLLQASKSHANPPSMERGFEAGTDYFRLSSGFQSDQLQDLF